MDEPQTGTEEYFPMSKLLKTSSECFGKMVFGGEDLFTS